MRATVGNNGRAGRGGGEGDGGETMAWGETKGRRREQWWEYSVRAGRAGGESNGGETTAEPEGAAVRATVGGGARQTADGGGKGLW